MTTADEWDLLTGNESSNELVNAVVKGDYVRVLRSPIGATLLKPFAHLLGKGPLTFAEVKLSTPHALDALCVAIAALHAFIQANWTGPEVDDELLRPCKLLRSLSPDSFGPRSATSQGDSDNDEVLDAAIQQASLDTLTVDGEPVYHLCHSPFLLLLSLRILQDVSPQDIRSWAWWRLRAFSVHSRILDSPQAPSSELLIALQPLKDFLQEQHWGQLRARLLIDEALALQRSGRENEAKDGLEEASRANGLQYVMSGALGKQTKFQRDEKTIMVVLARSAEAVEESTADELEQAEEDDEVLDMTSTAPNKGWKARPALSQTPNMPSEYLHNDETLLERAHFNTDVTDLQANSFASGSLERENASKPSLLDPLDCCTLLGLCLNIQSTSPDNELTASETSAFVNRVLAHARNWSVHTMALLLRSRIEADRTRTAQRSALQLQALIDQMPTSDSSVVERLRFVHELELPSKWEMQAELARRFAMLGVLRSALEIFEHIEMWQEVVQCWGALGRQDKGIEVLRDLLHGRKAEADHVMSERRGGRAVHVGEQLNTARQAKLWCLLGDLEVEKAQEHYMQAWNVSGRRSARAARSLGGVAYAKAENTKAALWLRRALRIQPLYARSWFMLGCVYMRFDTTQGYIEAARCFRRCVALEDEDAESWNNLASCYLRLAQNSEGVLREAHLAEQGEAQTDQNAVLQGVNLADDNEDDAMSDVDSLHSRDSGVAGVQSDMDTDADTEAETDTEETVEQRQRRRRQEALIPALSGGGGGSGQGAFDVKLLAHRALAKALRFAHDDWRVWNNFMIVSVDCGMMNDAVRSLVRVVELRGHAISAEKILTNDDADNDSLSGAVDVAVLNRIVDAVTRAPSREQDAVAEVEDSQQLPQAGQSLQAHVQHNPHEGHGLWPAVRSLFDDTLLPRISSSAALWRAYARLLFWRGKYRGALDAHLAAWQASYGSEARADECTRDKRQWLSAVEALTELCELLENFGQRDVYISTQAQDDERELDVDEAKRTSNRTEQAMANWRFRARSLIRTFIGRIRDAFESEPEFERLLELRDSLSSSSATA